MLPVNRRVLIVDDNVDIHKDFKKILGGTALAGNRRIQAIEAALFEDDPDMALPPAATDPSLAEIQYELDFASQGEEAVKKVTQSFEEDRPFALIFMDVRMPPGMDGVETIATIWAKYPNIEIVICSAYSDYSFNSVVEKLGTTDRLLFLNKPFDSIAVKQMALSLSRKWSLHEQERQNVALLECEARQRRASETRLHEMIHRDPVSGLSNRLEMIEYLESAIENARKNCTRFAVFGIDLDRFNEVIDTLGYQIGDNLIECVTDRLRTGFDSVGTLYRQGTHEFALLLEEVHSHQNLCEVAEQIQATFEHAFVLTNLNVDIHVNLGIVIFPDHGSTADLLLRHADMTLEHARHSEQNYCFYTESMNKYSPQRLMLLGDLKNALNNDELMLYFQPKLRMRDQKVDGVEALVRWAHTSLGFVPPSRFIPVAEQCGLIKPLTDWVFDKVTLQWRRWKDAGLDLSMTINLTAHDLSDKDLHVRVKAALDRRGMPADRLCLEISERGMMVDREQAIATMDLVHDLGVVLAIDNFGTGYSSLAYLKNLPVNEIKIDRSFIVDLSDNPNEIAIVRSMVELGHNLGLAVSAEGVMTRKAFELLSEFGCDEVQGNYINEPVPSGELRLWLDDMRKQAGDDAEQA